MLCTWANLVETGSLKKFWHVCAFLGIDVERQASVLFIFRMLVKGSVPKNGHVIVSLWDGTSVAAVMRKVKIV